MKIPKLLPTMGLLVAGLLISTTPVLAAVVYDNGGPLAAFSISDLDGNRRIAENFTLGSSATIANVTWSGAYYTSNTPTQPDDFTIVFYEDSTGLPGATLGSYTPGNDVNRLDSGSNNVFGGDIYNYSANIAPLNLTAGDFWISIFNDTAADTDDNWQWSISRYSPDGDGSSYQNGNNSWNTFLQGRDLSFALNDTPAVVPLPAAVWLMGSGLLALLGFSRRKATHA